MLAFLLSLMVGVGLAFLLDFLDDSVKSIDDIDRYIHLPALALIPAARTEKGRLPAEAAAAQNASTALALVNDSRSPMAEAYRHLRTSLLLSSAGNPPRTILVTSSQPSEGKTTTAVNTAFMLAQTGAEVLIIDCDLRRPRLHAGVPQRSPRRPPPDRAAGRESNPSQSLQLARRVAGAPGTSDADYAISFALVLSSNTLISGGLPDRPSSCQRDTTRS